MSCVLTFFEDDRPIVEHKYDIDLTSTVKSFTPISKGGYHYRYFGTRFHDVFTRIEDPGNALSGFSMIVMQNDDYSTPLDIDARRHVHIDWSWSHRSADAKGGSIKVNLIMDPKEEFISELCSQENKSYHATPRYIPNGTK